MEDKVRSALASYLAEAESRPTPRPTVRDRRLVSMNGKVDAVIGMRRVGKSWLLLARMRELLDAGIPRSRLLHIDFEDERLAGLTVEHLQFIEDAFFHRHPESHGQPCWYFFDEIQNVVGWEQYVRRLLADPRRQIAITGSSARLLSSEIATAMRGRSLTTELWPFSFREVLRHRGVEVPSTWPPSAAVRARLQAEFDRYYATGGFPEVLDVSTDIRRAILQNCTDVAILRDIVERHSVRNVPLLRGLVRRLVRSVGCLASVHGLVNDLKSQGFAFGKDLIYELIDHVEDAFLASLLPVDTQSERRRQVHPRKVYIVDHALARAAAMTEDGNHGHALENIVYLELRRRGQVLGYHVTAGGYEVDFLFQDGEGRRRLVQVCAAIEDPETRAREVRALAEAMVEIPGVDAIIVTMANEGVERVGDSDVPVVPVWRWLLEARGTALAPTA
ncbi:MAG: ATP-binding protein [Planctomycetes bacterium]|nr:ATP-binding protein [Planctomycetota bacterium]